MQGESVAKGEEQTKQGLLAGFRKFTEMDAAPTMGRTTVKYADALPDYSQRLARRTHTSVARVIAKFDTPRQREFYE